MFTTHPFVNTTCSEVGPYCTVDESIYGYMPSIAFNAFFASAFALLVPLHIILGFYNRTPFFTYLLVIGCISEALGYGGRVMLSHNPFDSTGFDLQISCLIFAPSFFAAAVYLRFKHLASVLGPGAFNVPPRLYLSTFVPLDMVCLILQAIGGGLAGSAGKNVNKRMLGTNLMIAGIVFQTFTMSVFIVLGMRVLWKPLFFAETVVCRKANKLRRYMIFLTIATLSIYGRCIYRIPELANGWANPIMRNQAGFIAMESFMILVATLALTASTFKLDFQDAV